MIFFYSGSNMHWTFNVYLCWDKAKLWNIKARTCIMKLGHHRLDRRRVKRELLYLGMKINLNIFDVNVCIFVSESGNSHALFVLEFRWYKRVIEHYLWDMKLNIYSQLCLSQISIHVSHIITYLKLKAHSSSLFFIFYCFWPHISQVFSKLKLLLQSQFI